VKKRLFLLLLLSAACLASTTAATLQGTVTWIYDGDTIEVAKVGKVRLIGIDTPEKDDSDRDDFYLRQGVNRATLRRVAGQSRQFLIETVKGQRVTLEADAEEYDRHGRRLAYVFLPDGSLLNEQLLARGYAAVYRRFDFRLKPDFEKVEALARQRALGLWEPSEGSP